MHGAMSSVQLVAFGMVLQLYLLTDFDGCFTPDSDDCAEQTMPRCLLSPFFHCRVQVFQLVVPELGEDLLEQRQRRVGFRPCSAIRLKHVIQLFQLTKREPISRILRGVNSCRVAHSS